MKDYTSSEHHKKRTHAISSTRKKRFLVPFHRKRNAAIKKRIEIQNRYETAHLVSEILTSILFLAGSFCLFYPEVKLVGSCLFILGSIQMLIRGLLRISYHLKIKKWDDADNKQSYISSGQLEQESYLKRGM